VHPFYVWNVFVAITFYQTGVHFWRQYQYFICLFYLFLGLTASFSGQKVELYTMRALEYSYESTASKGKYKRSFSKPTNKKIFINENVDIGTAEQQNETIKVTVIWDGDNGRTEVLFLKNTRQK
jgi:hypothetical protein